jgi:hypothetical protein
VPPQRFLRENQLAVNRDLEEAAGRLHQADFDVGKGLFQLSRQTGGSRMVVSDNAILDNHMHDVEHLATWANGEPPRIVAATIGEAKGSAGCDAAPCQPVFPGISI